MITRTLYFHIFRRT